MDALDELFKSYTKTHPAFQPGDTVRVHFLVKEREKERIQIFEGVVIGRKGEGVSATFTVRKISDGVGVERVFPLHSPFIRKIEPVRRGEVRRAKLYFLRKKKGKAARLREVLRTEGPAPESEAGTEPPEPKAPAEN